MRYSPILFFYFILFFFFCVFVLCVFLCFLCFVLSFWLVMFLGDCCGGVIWFCCSF